MIRANELKVVNQEDRDKTALEVIENKILLKNKDGKKKLLIKENISDNVKTILEEHGYNVEINVEDNETTISW